MDNELQAAIAPLVDAMKELPKVDFVPKILDSNYLRCSGCEAWCAVVDMPRYDSGVVPNVMVPLCKDCRSSYAPLCKIVCHTCKTVVGWFEPYKDNDGFMFKTAKSYHISTCPVCTPGLEKSHIVEKVLYLKDKDKAYRL